ncbi:MAG: 4-alpha-glucanotransferase, partial [Clostridia bacterium]
KTLYSSKAELVVLTMQDLSALDTEKRMNTPSVLGCWKYMAEPKEFSQGNAEWLAELTTITGR